jgi:hypothetical protein
MRAVGKELLLGTGGIADGGSHQYFRIASEYEILRYFNIWGWRILFEGYSFRRTSTAIVEVR